MSPQLWLRRGALSAALTILLTGSLAATAAATFPGRNGPIAFRQFDPATERFPLLRALPDGTQVTELSDRPGFFSDWRADGRRIAFDFFEPDGDEQIATMKADGTDLRVITSGPGIHEVPSWSPDGRRIVFGYSPEADPETPGFETRLWTMRADGSHARPLPIQPPGFDVEPKYAPNGLRIAYMRLRMTSDGEQQQAVFIVDAQGGHVRRLTPWALNAEHPTWSPDSRWIAFNSPDGTIEAMRPNGRGRHTILAATNGRGGHKPWFSPDGSRILFMCENRGLLAEPPQDYNEDICVMDADGSNIVNLTNTPEKIENWPSWGPAPNQHDD
jgi:Tol biopolymer transport system component